MESGIDNWSENSSWRPTLRAPIQLSNTVEVAIDTFSNFGIGIYRAGKLIKFSTINTLAKDKFNNFSLFLIDVAIEPLGCCILSIPDLVFIMCQKALRTFSNVRSYLMFVMNQHRTILLDYHEPH